MSNALIHETSPYLLQHAHNPVDWQPWGEEAFELAQRDNKLVFLSVGYSTCHWCHVMERESFENERIADIMNRHFVNVKVDREERPDIDAAYMAYVQATTGQGGWPMSVWLTADAKPVFGGTYFPPEDAHGRPGFGRACEELARLWREERPKLEENAAAVMAHLQHEADSTVTLRGMPDPKVFGDFIDQCESMFDPDWGGFGGAPKFPRPVIVRTLMQLSERFHPDSDEVKHIIAMCGRTLTAMAAGGIHDHLGGGFHRYSVDRFWHVPHYEKMLYDQAQLASAFLDGWQITGNPLFRETAAGIFHYLTDTLRDNNGAFHAAEDADSLPDPDAPTKKEGAFWTWSHDEINSLLGKQDAGIFIAAYGVQADGNARPESDPHGELTGRNTLFRAMNDEALAARFELPEEEIRNRLEAARKILLQHRAKRPPPHRDDKIVTAWNGLAIGALARGARLFDDPALAKAAGEAAEFLKRELTDGTRLLRSFRMKRGKTPAFPADYVFLIHGLIELHAVASDDGWLDWAQQLQNELDARFWDPGQAGYVMRPGLGGETLLVIREDYDGAEPSANHLAAENLLKLAAQTDNDNWTTRAHALLRAGSRVLETRPFAAPVLLAAADLAERGVMKFQTGSRAQPKTLELLRTSYLPRAVFSNNDSAEVILCENQACHPFGG